MQGRCWLEIEAGKLVHHAGALTWLELGCLLQHQLQGDVCVGMQPDSLACMVAAEKPLHLQAGGWDTGWRWWRGLWLIRRRLI